MSHIRIADGGRVGQFETVNRDLDWTDAACRGMDLEIFFPPASTNGRRDWDTPRRICQTCPLRDQCLNYALDHERGAAARSRHGMYGGKTPDERHQIEKERRP